MTIVEKINQIHKEIANDPDGTAALADELQRLACMAIQQGINSRVWSDYMKFFASNPDQLRRLVGEDKAYNETIWGGMSLAYLAANGCCGATTTVDTTRNMPADMLNNLDAGGLNATEDGAFLGEV